MKGVIHWVVAFRPEAEVLIQRMRLRPLTERSAPFEVFASEDGLNRLVISGAGKAMSAGAVGYLSSFSNDTELVGWINFGIAGSGTPDYGSCFAASRITDRETGASWYPVNWAKKLALPRREILTVGAPISDYPTNRELVDMEASGFCPVALAASSMERCQVLKVVSDDPDHPLTEVNPKLAREVCVAAFDQMEPWVKQFRAFINAEASQEAEPPGLDAWLDLVRFSATEVHQLRRLLQQWVATHPGEVPPPLPPPETRAKAGAALDFLRREVFQAG